MLNQIKQIIEKFNNYGVPLPMIRDYKTGAPSVSLTLLFISSLFVEAGLIGKYSKLLDGIDINQAINWFMICAGLYLGRTLTNKNVKVESNDDKTQESSNPQ